MSRPHKHKELIVAWAEGHKIEHKLRFMPGVQEGEWRDFDGIWRDNFEYRIKPEAPQWPVTRMTDEQLNRAFELAVKINFYDVAARRAFANAAIARACEDGDVVPAALKFFFEQMVPASMLEKVAKAVQAACRAEHVLKWNLVASDIAMKELDINAIIASVKEGKE